MKIVRIENPAFLALDAFLDLFKRAFAGDRPTKPGEAVKIMLDRLLHQPGSLALWVAEDGGQLTGLLIALAPQAPWLKFPQVYHYFSQGGTKQRNALLGACIEWAKTLGYNSILALNATGHPDEAWARPFRQWGKAVRLGSAFRFEIEREKWTQSSAAAPKASRGRRAKS